MRQLHTDAHERGAEAALIQLAAAHYGADVSFALVHPSDPLHRAAQHGNAESMRRGERPNAMVVFR